MHLWTFLFFFRSKLAHFKRFCFVSISNQFDIESFIIEVIYNFKFVGQMRYGTPDKIFFCLVKPKMNNNSVSCLRLLSHFSSLTSPCLHSTVSRLLSLVSCSCLMSPVSHLLFHASCLVSCLLSSHLPCCKLCRFKWQWFVRFNVLFARPRFGPYIPPSTKSRPPIDLIKKE